MLLTDSYKTILFMKDFMLYIVARVLFIYNMLRL